MKAIFLTLMVGVFALPAWAQEEDFEMEVEGVETETSQPVEAVAPQSKSDNHFNVRLYPVPTVIGMPEMSFHYAVAHWMSLGVGASGVANDRVIRNVAEEQTDIRSANDYVVTGTNFNLRGDIGLNGSIMSDTFYVAPILSQMNYKLRSRSLDRSAIAEATVFTTMVGYQWMWDHFNMNVALGGKIPLSEEYRVEDRRLEVNDRDLRKVARGGIAEFGLGYAF